MFRFETAKDGTYCIRNLLKLGEILEDWYFNSRKLLKQNARNLPMQLCMWISLYLIVAILVDETKRSLI